MGLDFVPEISLQSLHIIARTCCRTVGEPCGAGGRSWLDCWPWLPSKLATSSGTRLSTPCAWRKRMKPLSARGRSRTEPRASEPAWRGSRGSSRGPSPCRRAWTSSRRKFLRQPLLSPLASRLGDPSVLCPTSCLFWSSSFSFSLSGPALC